MSQEGTVKRVCLAYSGGLDTSVILRWLIEEYGCEDKAFKLGFASTSGYGR